MSRLTREALAAALREVGIQAHGARMAARQDGLDVALAYVGQWRRYRKAVARLEARLARTEGALHVAALRIARAEGALQGQAELVAISWRYGRSTLEAEMRNLKRALVACKRAQASHSAALDARLGRKVACVG